MSVNTTQPDLEKILYHQAIVEIESMWSLSIVCKYRPKGDASCIFSPRRYFCCGFVCFIFGAVEYLHVLILRDESFTMRWGVGGHLRRGSDFFFLAIHWGWK